MSPAEGSATSRDLALRAIGDRAGDPFDGAPSREGLFVQTLRARFPQLDVRDLSPTLDAMRLIKSAARTDFDSKGNATRRSRADGGDAFDANLAIYEHELDALAKYVFFRNGAQGEAYYSLIASAANAYYPALQRRQAADARRRLPADGLRAGRRVLHERHHAHDAGERTLQPLATRAVLLLPWMLHGRARRHPAERHRTSRRARTRCRRWTRSWRRQPSRNRFTETPPPASSQNIAS